MLEIDLTDEQHAFVEAIRDFCRREAGTREQRLALVGDGDDTHNPALYRRLADLGWLGISLPEEYGGGGGGAVDMCLLLEEISRGVLPVWGLAVSLIVAGTYERVGTLEQKRQKIGAIAQGAVAALAMSEPEAGSDVGNLSCSAVRRPDGSFVIDGQKTWISAAQHAEWVLVIVRTGRGERKHDGLSLLCVPAGTPGMEIRGIDTMGGREVNDVYFSACAVGPDALVGAEGAGWTQLMSGLNTERLVIAARVLGLAERTFDDTLAYVKERKQFGRPIGSFQSLRHRLAELATELACCRLLVYDVARRVDANPGTVFRREASMAKLKVTEVAKRVALEGMQMMGGYGYAAEYEMEQKVRWALVSTVYGGTSEIQLEIIGKSLGL